MTAKRKKKKNRVIEQLRRKFPGVWTYTKDGTWRHEEGWEVQAYAALAPKFDGDDDSFETQYRRTDTGEQVLHRPLELLEGSVLAEPALRWMQVRFRSEDGAPAMKGHVVPAHLADSLADNLARRGGKLDCIEPVKNKAFPFWIPSPAFAKPAIVSFDLDGLKVEVEVASFDYWLERARSRQRRAELSEPVVKYHLDYWCIVFTVGQQERFLAWMEGVAAEARALAAAEAERFNERVAGNRPESYLAIRPRKVGQPVGEC